MSNYEDKMTISGVSLEKGARTGAVDYRETFNEMMANITQKKKFPPIFGNGFAGASVGKASTDFNG